MAEGTVTNKKLLAISLLLGLTAVILFYVYDWVKTQALRGDRIVVLKWARDLGPGEAITKGDIVPVEISKRTWDQIGGIVKSSDREAVVPENTIVSRSVQKHRFVLYTDVSTAKTQRPSERIAPGMVAITLPVDPYHTPGDMLRVGDRVDVIGLLAVGKDPVKAYTLVQNLKVTAVGGQSDNPEEGELINPQDRRRRPGIRVYRSITVQVGPALAVQLADLMPRIRGKVWLVIRNPTDTKAKHDNRLNDEILPALSAPLPDVMY
jgi:Flp pilus assembly protein CpaB